jgi:hypothetical protein
VVYYHQPFSQIDFLPRAGAFLPVQYKLAIPLPRHPTDVLVRTRASAQFQAVLLRDTGAALPYPYGWWCDYDAALGIWNDRGSGSSVPTLTSSSSPNIPWVMQEHGSPLVQEAPFTFAGIDQADIVTWSIGGDRAIESEARRSSDHPGVLPKTWVSIHLIAGVDLVTPNTVGAGISLFLGARVYVDTIWKSLT